MALIGYARVSTAEQDTALQTDALLKAGCERVFEDTVSGVKINRPGLAEALAYLRDGDVLAVWRLDRLGRSLPHLIEMISSLHAREIGFRSLTESIDMELELPPFRGHFPTERKSPTCQDLNHPTRKPFATKWSNWCAAAALQVHCPRSLAATPPVS